ncbi:hypothetical protein BCSAG_49170 [Bacillus cereus]
MYLPWECESCKHKWQSSPFLTYVECPKCDSEFISHGSMIVEDFEIYNIYDEEEENEQ